MGIGDWVDLSEKFQFYLDVRDEGTVNPFLGCGAAGLTDDGTKIELGETHLIGIETDLMFVCSVLIHEIDESVEDGLLTTL